MKTLIVIREKDYGWLSPFFPGVNPLVMPVCNKPFIEYLIDFSILAGSSAIRIISDGPLNEVERYCEDGSRWGVDVSYASILGNDSIETVIEKNRKYCADQRLLIISGYLFIRYENRQELRHCFAMASGGTLAENERGSIVLAGTPEITGQLPAATPFSLVEFDSIDNYFRLSAEILKEYPSPYVLPGYCNEPDCHIGRNVVIGKGAEIRKPVIIGNNVQIMKGAVVGPSAVVGSNVIIDRESTVSRSILLDNTYIGEQLEVVDRIAAGNILVDPRSGVSIAMEDPHLLSSLPGSAHIGSGLFRYLFHAIVALLLILLLSLPYLMLVPILKAQGRWKTGSFTFHDIRQGKNLRFVMPSIADEGGIGSLAKALSLDRFPMLFRALAGTIAVIGSFPVEVSHRLEAGYAATGYRPAVFSYAEAEDWPVNAEDSAIVEQFYAAHGSPVRDMVLTIKAFLNRIHSKVQ